MSGEEDLLEKLEHDHVPLSNLVTALRGLVVSVQQKERTPRDIHAPFADALAQVEDDLLEHFGQEEECIFPFLIDALPLMRAEVSALASAHDMICGAVARLSRIANGDADAFNEHFPQLEALFARFDAAYVAHAQGEVVVLRDAGRKLDIKQRTELAEAARGLL